MKKKTVEKFISKKVEGSWMVISRHFAMPGGVVNYGSADINEFFTSKRKAIKYAEELIRKDVSLGCILPTVWVLRCERTYQNTNQGIAYAYSEYEEKTKK